MRSVAIAFKKLFPAYGLDFGNGQSLFRTPSHYCNIGILDFPVSITLAAFGCTSVTTDLLYPTSTNFDEIQNM